MSSWVILPYISRQSLSLNQQHAISAGLANQFVLESPASTTSDCHAYPAFP